MENFRKFIESELMRPYLSAATEDVSGYQDAVILADVLQDSNDPEDRRMADLLKLTWNYHLGNLDKDDSSRQRIIELFREVRSTLFDGHRIFANENQISDLRNNITYYHYGNIIRREHDGRRETITIDDIQDPLILRAFAFMFAHALWSSRYQSSGIKRPFDRKKRYTKKQREYEKQFFGHRLDSLFRTFLDRILREISNIEEDLYNIRRLQRNRRHIESLESRLRHRHFDQFAIAEAISRHLRKYDSPFLKQYLPYLQKLYNDLVQWLQERNRNVDQYPMMTTIMSMIRRMEGANI